jgi:hypothetical protein
LKSFRIGASVVAVEWSCFRSSREPVEVTFESPSQVREILNFRLGEGIEIALPDSVEILEIGRARDPGSVCTFGTDSRLRDLRFSAHTSQRLGFMRVSEAFLKRRRSMMEWTHG